MSKLAYIYHIRPKNLSTLRFGINGNPIGIIHAVHMLYTGSTWRWELDSSGHNRKSQHKSACKGKEKNWRVYKFINENGGWENWEMVSLKTFQLLGTTRKERQKEKEKVEQTQMDKFNSFLNTKRALRTPEQKTEQERLRNSKYFAKIKGLKKKCDNCGAEVSHINMNRHKRSNKCKNFVAV